MKNISKCHQFLVHGTDLTGLPPSQAMGKPTPIFLHGSSKYRISQFEKRKSPKHLLQWYFVIMCIKRFVTVLTVTYLLSSLLLAILTNVYPLLNTLDYLALDIKTSNASIRNNTILDEVPRNLWLGLYVNHGISFAVGKSRYTLKYTWWCFTPPWHNTRGIRQGWN